MKTALVVIDVQKDYFPGGRMALPGSLAAAGNVRRLLDVFREQQQAVIHVRHIAAREDATFFIPGTPGTAIHDAARPLADETVIEKHFPNSFKDTGLLTSLKELQTEEVVICGMMSEMCVDATVRAAFDLGFKCVVAHDACAAHERVFAGVRVSADNVHAAFMSALGAVYAWIASTDELISEMRRSRG